MEKLFIYVSCVALAVVVVLPFALADKRRRESLERQGEPEPTPQDGEAAAVRAAVYSAYRGMIRQHAHGLHLLSACLDRSVNPSRAAALYALRQTADALQRFDCRPIFEAIAALEK